MMKSRSTDLVSPRTKKKNFKRHALGSVGAAAICLTAGLAHAQDAQGDAETVTVTGTRVQRDGYSAPTPVTVIGTEQLQAASPANLADYVNQMPAVIGSTTPANSEGSISNGAAGIYALNLRNLGTSRTLVLLDGHRSAASLATGEVDINTIPQQLVKRIDIVTGGASADYGSDAVGGVVNFVLDNDYTGFKTDLEYGETTYGDQPNYKADLTYGTAFDGGRGHLILSGEAFTTQEIHGQPRPWAAQNYYTYINPAYTATNGQPYYISAHGVVPSQLAPGGIIVSGPAMGTYFGSNAAVGHLDYGTIAGPWMQGGDQQTTCVNSCGTADLAPAETRLSAYARVSYNITDDIEVYATASVSHAQVKSNNGNNYSNVGNITLKADNAFLPESVRQVLANAGATQFTMGSSNEGMPEYGMDNGRLNQRYLVGSDGTFHLFGDWKYDAFVDTSLANLHEADLGNWSSTRMAQASDAVVVTPGNVGSSGYAIGSIQCRSSLANPANGCVPLSRIGIAGGMQSAADYAKGIGYVEYAQPWRNEYIRETDAGFNISGTPFSNWAGPVSVAFGGEWRLESINGFVEKQFQSGWQVGNYLVTQGHYSVAEGYLETVVPVMKGMDVNGAIRYTAYSTSGGVNTWKLGMNYQPVDDIRFRVTYSHDIRAPNLSELFSSGTSRTNNLLINGATYPFLQNQTGNANLSPEAANSLGAGIVLTPQFIPGLTASVDYFNISLAHEIGTIGVQQTANLCFISHIQSYCDAITSTGSLADNNLSISTVNIHPINYSSFKEEGIDFDTTYEVPLDKMNWFGEIPGSLRLHGLATHYMRAYTNDGFDPTTDIAGVNAPGGLNGTGGLPDWTYRIEATYTQDAWTLDLIGRGVSAGKVSNEYIQCLTGCPTYTLQNPTINNNHVPGAFYFDSTINYAFQTHGVDTEIFFTVKDMFNTAPVLVPLGGGSTVVTTSEQQQTNTSLYDTLGRVFRIGMRASL